MLRYRSMNGCVRPSIPEGERLDRFAQFQVIHAPALRIYVEPCRHPAVHREWSSHGGHLRPPRGGVQPDLGGDEGHQHRPCGLRDPGRLCGILGAHPLWDRPDAFPALEPAALVPYRGFSFTGILVQPITRSRDVVVASMILTFGLAIVLENMHAPGMVPGRETDHHQLFQQVDLSGGHHHPGLQPPRLPALHCGDRGHLPLSLPHPDRQGRAGDMAGARGGGAPGDQPSQGLHDRLRAGHLPRRLQAAWPWPTCIPSTPPPTISG